MCQSTCCNNTATENAMCERLVVDDIVHWARQYKVAVLGNQSICDHHDGKMKATLNDQRWQSGAPRRFMPPIQIDGFRFDIMGHLLVSTLAKMRSRLDELTLEKDGVDGR